MKRIYLILIVVGSLMAAKTLQAQTDRRTPQMTRGTEQSRQTNNQNNGLSQLTVRAQNMNELLNRDIGNARWLRIIYRQLDLLKEKNAPLYYPTTSVRGEGNLFSTIFKLAVEGLLPIYENPISGNEVFDEDHILDIKKGLLDPYEIFYETVPGQGGTVNFIINENDIPSELVKSFYVKEATYFDQNNSVYDTKILALCPIINLYSDFGDQQSSMFWVLYEDIRPYVSIKPIMTSNINNAKTFTVDDYFRRRMYDGEIIMTENLMNLPLMAYCETPEDMLLEQERIEGELVAFEKALWFQPDSVRLAPPTNRRAAARAARRTPTVKQEKAPAAPSNTSSSTRSIRR